MADNVVLTGSRSRIVVADLDYNPDCALLLDERLGPLFAEGRSRETYIERTGDGGLHVYASLPDVVSVHSVDAYLAPGIELQADGRLVIVAPSENVKGRYAWLEGHEPWTLAPAVLSDTVLVTMMAPHVV